MSMSGTVQASFQCWLNLMSICRERHFKQNLLQWQDTSSMGLCACLHNFTALGTALAQDLSCDASHSTNEYSLQSCLNIMLCNEQHISRCFKETGGESQMLHLEAMLCMGGQVTLVLCLEEECLLAGNGAWTDQGAGTICGSEHIPKHHRKLVLARNCFFTWWNRKSGQGFY